MARRPSLTRAHRALLGVVAAGACLISGIGFAGSYNTAVHVGVATGLAAGIVQIGFALHRSSKVQLATT